MAHALLMLYLFTKKVGSLRPYHVGHTTLRAIVGALVMILPISGLLFILKDVVPPGAVGYLIRVVAAALAGGGVYFLVLAFYGRGRTGLAPTSAPQTIR